ncbi:MAG: ABC transporter ATP-binding protein [Clostridia bacterium]|nr:ABC transporter ATP-binding protein [Clostridia bacterium]
MIECSSLSCSIGKKQILSDIDLTAKNGKITVIIGPNGSGKTSLLRCISGAVGKKELSSGNILINGKNTVDYSAKERAGVLSFMPQALPMPQITVFELVSYGRSPYIGSFGMLSEKDKKAVYSAIARVSLSDLCDTSVSVLSGGERQLAYFAMLIAQETSNLLLDEPTASLDEKHKAKIFDELTKLKKDNKAILLILHDITEAVRIADNICVLDNGKSVFCGTSEQFIQSDIPKTVFGVTPYQYINDGKSTYFFSR